jgi:hypothetical protein
MPCCPTQPAGPAITHLSSSLAAMWAQPVRPYPFLSGFFPVTHRGGAGQGATQAAPAPMATALQRWRAGWRSRAPTPHPRRPLSSPGTLGRRPIKRVALVSLYRAAAWGFSPKSTATAPKIREGGGREELESLGGAIRGGARGCRAAGPPRHRPACRRGRRTGNARAWPLRSWSSSGQGRRRTKARSRRVRPLLFCCAPRRHQPAAASKAGEPVPLA